MGEYKFYNNNSNVAIFYLLYYYIDNLNNVCFVLPNAFDIFILPALHLF